MEKIEIYAFQLDVIIDALRITSNINYCSLGETCYDRQVRQALAYAKNAKEGKIDDRVPYLSGTIDIPNPLDSAEIKYVVEGVVVATKTGNNEPVIINEPVFNACFR